KMASKVLVGFPGALPGAVMVGNPVRQALTQVVPAEQRYAQRQGPLRVLVIGGSLGAAALNTVIPQALAQLPDHERPIVTHQAGQQHVEALRDTYEDLGVQAECHAFIDDMAGALAEADVVICRAGAMAVAEVAVVGVA